MKPSDFRSMSNQEKEIENPVWSVSFRRRSACSKNVIVDQTTVSWAKRKRINSISHVYDLTSSPRLPSSFLLHCIFACHSALHDFFLLFEAANFTFMSHFYGILKRNEKESQHQKNFNCFHRCWNYLHNKIVLEQTIAAFASAAKTINCE